MLSKHCILLLKTGIAVEVVKVSPPLPPSSTDAELEVEKPHPSTHHPSSICPHPHLSALTHVTDSVQRTAAAVFVLGISTRTKGKRREQQSSFHQQRQPKPTMNYSSGHTQYSSLCIAKKWVVSLAPSCGELLYCI